MEKISAVITMYNSEKFIIDTMKSLLNQSDKFDEIVIIDDKSVDESKKIVSEILDNDECYSIKQLDISGNDIMTLGFKGNDVGEILNFLLDAVINEKVTNSILSLIEYIKNKRD